MNAHIVILVAAVVLGSAYGYTSAVENENPYYPRPGGDAREEDQKRAWNWEPSPLWFPSYLLCKVPRNGLGIRHTKSGYQFRSGADRLVYRGASTVVGGLMGAVLGLGAMLVVRGTRRTRTGPSS